MIPKKILLWLLPLLAIVVFVLIMSRGQVEGKTDAWQHDEGFIFGTIYNITYQYGVDLKAEIESELKKVDQEFSMFNEESTVARINRGDSLVERSDMFNEVYTLAMQVNADRGVSIDGRCVVQQHLDIAIPHSSAQEQPRRVAVTAHQVCDPCLVRK